MTSKKKMASEIKIKTKNNKAILVDYPDNLTLIGKGRSAFVFKISGENKVIKLFFPQFSHLAKQEAEIYDALADIPYFPKCYESGKNYIVEDFIEGKTMFQCLVEGVNITERMVQDVDTAIQSARSKGLNPSDIHLRNIIVTPGDGIKLIDVARFRQSKDCMRWRDLKKAFYFYYQKPHFPKRWAPVLLDLIGAVYKKGWLAFLLGKNQNINLLQK
ncbi:protein kinase family protein [Scopulibacillus cellulosilyticus]|uniref:Protein kinase family protein n=1 Tax=Scopulibacillus cellulosilyticus TaxID=2665665 RepID=A0ABW2PRW7_9BACL